MPSFAFDADDVAVGDGRVIVASGARRLLLRNVDVDAIERLRTASATGVLDLREDEPLLEKLSSKGLVRRLAAPPPASRRVRRFLPAWMVAKVARRLVALASGPSLGLAVLASVAVLLLAMVAPVPIGRVSKWTTHVPLGEFLSASAVFAACVLAHEIGHAAACYRETGMVGAIRLRLYRGVIVVTTDVSSLCLTGPRGRALIAVAGVAFQIACSTLLLLVPVGFVRVGATLSLLSVAFSLVPLPGTDGYWFLTDFFGVRLTRPGHGDLEFAAVRRVYIAALCVATAYFGYVILREAEVMRAFGWDHLRDLPVRSGVLLAISAYACVVFVLFIRKIFQFVRTGEVVAFN